MSAGPDGSGWAGYEGLGQFDPGSCDSQLSSLDDCLVQANVQAIHITPEGVIRIGMVAVATANEAAIGANAALFRVAR